MAKEYIDREEALSAIKQAFEKGERPSLYIKSIPTADVAEVRHGWWERVIPTKSAAKWSTKVSCSNCHSVGYMRYNYCPNCGCKMDKEE